MRVAVVGAGWAGLAAAVTLADAGAAVTLYESAPMAGGRARSAVLDTPLGRLRLDNGQHLLVGAYHETLGLIARLGGGAGLRREPMRLSAPSGLRLQAARLPAPLHLGWALLWSRGLGPGGRIAMIRLMSALKRARWQPRPGETVQSLLRRLDQPPALVERVWAPLCIGGLNTLPGEACAAAFCAVLRDTLGADRAAADFVGADAPLAALLPEPALAHLARAGARVCLHTPVRALRRTLDGWAVLSSAGEQSFDQVLLALPPWSAARLLQACGLAADPLGAFEPEPIATVWAFWRAGDSPRLPASSLLDEDPVRGRHGQWLFDRGLHQPLEGGPRVRVAGVVISAASRLAGVDPSDVRAGVAAQLVDAFGAPAPAALRLVTERRATFRCTPDRPRLQASHFLDRMPGLWLAGDWLWHEYPATLEAAVRSGLASARAMLLGRA